MYGSWLPNDPRGSASRYVGSRALFEAGGTTFHPERMGFDQLTTEHQSRIAELRRKLNRPWVVHSDIQIATLGKSLHTFRDEMGLLIWACSILPCHVHLVFARCGRKSEDLIDALKNRVEDDFREQKLVPSGCDGENSMFADKQWIVYLDSESAIESAIAYVVENPVREGRPLQDWPFVTPYGGLEGNVVAYND
jgi:REP element-mobilizing transposase RayT